jgi:DNA processing protein
MRDSSLKSFLWLRTLLSVDGIGPLKIFNIIEKFQTYDNLSKATTDSLMRINGINQKLAEKIIHKLNNYRRYHAEFEKELSRVEDQGGRIMTYFCPEYPEILKNIYFPPVILYILGEFKEQDIYSIAVVGTRNPTRYGIAQCEKLVQGLASRGITVVSGLARGIDSIVHSTVLKNSGRTIAVTGSGLDVIYPPENRRYYRPIAENGAIITEYPPGTKPDAQNFPRRNRIISGLSLGSVIIETKRSGGAMLTARYALDQNREVFALPGNVSSNMSEGTNLLIQRGEAKLIIDLEDIFLELELKLKPCPGTKIPKPSPELNLFEEKIYNCLSDEPKQIDKIAEETKISTSESLVYLLSLEFKGVVTQFPGKVFARSGTNTF